MMDLEAFYNKVISMIPIVHNDEMDVRDLLAEKLEEYVKLIDELDAPWPLRNKSISVKAAKDLSNLLIECFDYIYSGNRIKAYQLLEEEQRRRKFSIIKVAVGKSLYRMRKREPDKLFTYRDMLPIPPSKRYLVQTQRYSMPGQPCLYLGVTPYSCWEEMHRPPISDCVVCRYEVVKDFNVLSLALPSLKEFKAHYLDWLRYFPMILASMITVKDYKHSFKAEYVIPQLLMEWIMTTEEARDRDIKGIFYTSVHINKEFQQPAEYFNNLALPVPGPKHTKDCVPLTNLFKLTNPTCEDYQRIKHGSFVNEHTFNVSRDGNLYYTTQGIFDDTISWLDDTDEFPLHDME